MRRTSRTKSTPAAVKSAMPHSDGLSPTERRNPRSMKLDQLSPTDAVALMLNEEAYVTRALKAWQREIATVVQWIAHAFRTGGRLFYVGAGTSGRLGVLDASECPPTFRSDPAMVQGIIAGGETALRNAVEGAEDDVAAGVASLRERHATAKDVVIGIAASGTTPFVWGALGEAKRRRAKTVMLCFNPHLKIPATLKPKLLIAPDLGPELLTGSTRLKAGTATKLVLNMFTTLAMVQIGKVSSNLMVDVMPTNAKLRLRAVRILRELTGTDEASAQAALEANQWVIKKAALQLRKK